MTDRKGTIRTVLKNKANDQLTVTLPKSSGFVEGENVLVVAVDDVLTELKDMIVQEHTKSNLIVIDEAKDIPGDTINELATEDIIKNVKMIEASVDLCNQCGKAVNPKNKKCALGHPN